MHLLNFLGIHYEPWQLFAMAFFGLVVRGLWYCWLDDRAIRATEHQRPSAPVRQTPSPERRS